MFHLILLRSVYSRIPLLSNHLVKNVLFLSYILLYHVSFRDIRRYQKPTLNIEWLKKKSCLRGCIYSRFPFFFSSRFPWRAQRERSETSVKFIVSEACKRYFKVNSEPTIHRVSVYVLNCFIRLLSLRFSSRNESCVFVYFSLASRPSVFLYTLADIECDLQARAKKENIRQMNIKFFYNKIIYNLLKFINYLLT